MNWRRLVVSSIGRSNRSKSSSASTVSAWSALPPRRWSRKSCNIPVMPDSLSMTPICTNPSSEPPFAALPGALRTRFGTTQEHNRISSNVYQRNGLNSLPALIKAAYERIVLRGDGTDGTGQSDTTRGAPRRCSNTSPRSRPLPQGPTPATLKTPCYSISLNRVPKVKRAAVRAALAILNRRT
jgi:hypothetical protein